MAALHFLLRDKDLDISKIKKVLEKDSSCVNDIINSFGETPLLRVLKLKNCSADIVEMLLNYGANPNRSNKLGTSALQLAIQHHPRDERLLKAMLQKGAYVRGNMFNGIGKRTLMEYLLKCQDNSLLEIFTMFFKTRVDLNRSNNGRTVLVTALSCCNNKEIIRNVLEAGADPNRHDKKRNVSAMHSS